MDLLHGHRSSKRLSGETFDEHKQCEFVFGNGSKICPYMVRNLDDLMRPFRRRPCLLARFCTSFDTSSTDVLVNYGLPRYMIRICVSKGTRWTHWRGEGDRNLDDIANWRWPYSLCHLSSYIHLWLDRFMTFFWIPSKPFIRHQQFTLIAQKICDFLINNGIFPLKNDHHSMSSTRLGWSRWLPPSIASCYYQRAQRMPAVNCDTCLWRYMATRVTITMAVGDWEFGGGLCSISPWLTVSLSVVSWRSLAHLSRSAVRLCVPLNPRFASMVLVFLTSLWSYLFLGQIAFT